MRVVCPFWRLLPSCRYQVLGLPDDNREKAERMRDQQKYVISDDLVTVDDFKAFTRTTGYVCSVDEAYHPGWLFEDIRLNYGKSNDVPMLRLTLRDANEYAKWCNATIPTEEELRDYYLVRIKDRKQTKWTVFCWTSSREGRNVVILNGPYYIDDSTLYTKRLVVSEDYSDDFDAVALRLRLRIP
ncbi:MAG: SUMF1/EgtB/PvdO family nonheme iron enzyme [Planctomycetota bacterium]